MKKKLYLYLTMDKYSLPIFVADNARELAKMVGTNAGVVNSSIYHKHKTFERVEVDFDDEEARELFGKKGITNPR